MRFKWLRRRADKDLLAKVGSYIEENFCLEQDIRWSASDERDLAVRLYEKYCRLSPEQLEKLHAEPQEEICGGMPCAAPAPKAAAEPDRMFSMSDDIASYLDKLDISFSEALLLLIDRTGKKDSQIYKKAHVDRRLFSKIRSNPDYQPSKATALALAMALELSVDETEALIGRAGFTLSRSNKADLIVEYCIHHKIYDLNEVNAILYHYDQNLLGV